MRPVFVDVYTVYVFAVDIAADMISPVNYQTALTPGRRFVGEHGAKQSGADYEVVVIIQTLSPLILRDIFKSHTTYFSLYLSY